MSNTVENLSIGIMVRSVEQATLFRDIGAVMQECVDGFVYLH